MGFYAVRRGRVPGVYMSWEEARAQVYRYPNCDHHSFKTMGAAKHYVRTGQLHKTQHSKITDYFPEQSSQ